MSPIGSFSIMKFPLWDIVGTFKFCIAIETRDRELCTISRVARRCTPLSCSAAIAACCAMTLIE